MTGIILSSPVRPITSPPAPSQPHNRSRPAGTVSHKHALAQELAQTIMRWEKVPAIPFFTGNTAAFIHELAPDSFSTAGGDSTHVRVQVTTNAGALDREQQ